MIGWTYAWNKIIRQIIWPDLDLKRLMKIPPKTGILQFVDRYFIRAGYTNKLLTDEVCRIIYSDITGHDTEVPNVKKNILTFDIYLKQEEMRNIGDDRLVSRMDLIVERIYKLLTQQRYLAGTGYRFWLAPGNDDPGTRTNGYERRSISFYYMKPY